MKKKFAMVNSCEIKIVSIQNKICKLKLLKILNFVKLETLPPKVSFLFDGWVTPSKQLETLVARRIHT